MQSSGKKWLLVFLICVLSFSSLMAKGKSVFDYLSFDLGFREGYNVDAGEISVARYFAFSIPLSESLEVSYVSIGGTGFTLSYNLMKFNLSFGKRLGFGIIAGKSGANRAIGGGLFYRIYRDDTGSPFKASIRLTMDYINTDVVNSGGSVLIGLSSRIGL